MNSKNKLTPAFMERFAWEWLKHDILLPGYTNPGGYSASKVKVMRRDARKTMVANLGIDKLNCLERMFMAKYQRMLSRVVSRVKVKCAEEALRLLPLWAQEFEKRVNKLPEVLRKHNPVTAETVVRKVGEDKCALLIGVLRAMWGRLRAGGGALRGRALWDDALRAAATDCGRQLSLVADTWSSMRRVSLQKLRLLQAMGDAESNYAGTTISPADWLAIDMVLLYDPTEQLLTESNVCEMDWRSIVGALCTLVGAYQLDTSASTNAASHETRWRLAVRAYMHRGCSTSLVVLQRRWHELLSLARSAAAGLAREGLPPAPPLRHVLLRFPGAVSEPRPAWEELVRAGLVFAPDHSARIRITCQNLKFGKCPVSSAHSHIHMNWGELARVETHHDGSTPITPDDMYTTGESAAASSAATAPWGPHHSDVDLNDDDIILIEKEIETIDLDVSDDDAALYIDDRHAEAQNVKREILASRRQSICARLDNDLDAQLQGITSNQGRTNAGESYFATEVAVYNFTQSSSTVNQNMQPNSLGDRNDLSIPSSSHTITQPHIKRYNNSKVADIANTNSVIPVREQAVKENTDPVSKVSTERFNLSVLEQLDPTNMEAKIIFSDDDDDLNDGESFSVAHLDDMPTTSQETSTPFAINVAQQVPKGENDIVEKDKESVGNNEILKDVVNSDSNTNEEPKPSVVKTEFEVLQQDQMKPMESVGKKKRIGPKSFMQSQVAKKKRVGPKSFLESLMCRESPSYELDGIETNEPKPEEGITNTSTIINNKESKVETSSDDESSNLVIDESNFNLENKQNVGIKKDSMKPVREHSIASKINLVAEVNSNEKSDLVESTVNIVNTEVNTLLEKKLSYFIEKVNDNNTEPNVVSSAKSDVPINDSQIQLQCLERLSFESDKTEIYEYDKPLPMEVEEAVFNAANKYLTKCTDDSVSENVDNSIGEIDKSTLSSDGNVTKEMNNSVGEDEKKEKTESLNKEDQMDSEEPTLDGESTEKDVSPQVDDKLLLEASVKLYKIDELNFLKKSKVSKTLNLDLTKVDRDPMDLLKMRTTGRLKPGLKPTGRKRSFDQTELMTKPPFHIDYNSLDVDFSLKYAYELGVCKPVSVLLERIALEHVQGYLNRSGCDYDEQDGSLRPRKKVELSDIEEVRRINKNLLTAQVRPITSRARASNSTCGQKQTACRPADPATDSASESDASAPAHLDDTPHDYDTLTLQQGVDAGADVSLTPKELRDVLEKLKCQEELPWEAPRGRYCCAARRHINYNKARARMCARAGKKFYYMDLHGNSGNSHLRMACTCCCLPSMLAEQAAHQRLVEHTHQLNERLASLATNQVVLSRPEVKSVSKTKAPPVIEKPAPSKGLAFDESDDELLIRYKIKKYDEERTDEQSLTKRKKHKKKKKKDAEESETEEEKVRREKREYDKWLHERNVFKKYFTLNLSSMTPSKRAKASNTTKLSTDKPEQANGLKDAHTNIEAGPEQQQQLMTEAQTDIELLPEQLNLLTESEANVRSAHERQKVLTKPQATIDLGPEQQHVVPEAQMNVELELEQQEVVTEAWINIKLEPEQQHVPKASQLTAPTDTTAATDELIVDATQQTVKEEQNENSATQENPKSKYTKDALEFFKRMGWTVKKVQPKDPHHIPDKNLDAFKNIHEEHNYMKDPRVALPVMPHSARQVTQQHTQMPITIEPITTQNNVQPIALQQTNETANHKSVTGINMRQISNLANQKTTGNQRADKITLKQLSDAKPSRSGNVQTNTNNETQINAPGSEAVQMGSNPVVQQFLLQATATTGPPTITIQPLLSGSSLLTNLQQNQFFSQPQNEIFPQLQNQLFPQPQNQTFNIGITNQAESTLNLSSQLTQPQILNYQLVHQPGFTVPLSNQPIATNQTVNQRVDQTGVAASQKQASIESGGAASQPIIRIAGPPIQPVHQKNLNQQLNQKDFSSQIVTQLGNGQLTLSLTPLSADQPYTLVVNNSINNEGIQSSATNISAGTKSQNEKLVFKKIAPSEEPIEISDSESSNDEKVLIVGEGVVKDPSMPSICDVASVGRKDFESMPETQIILSDRGDAVVLQNTKQGIQSAPKPPTVEPAADDEKIYVINAVKQNSQSQPSTSQPQTSTPPKPCRIVHIGEQPAAAQTLKLYHVQVDDKRLLLTADALKNVLKRKKDETGSQSQSTAENGLLNKPGSKPGPSGSKPDPSGSKPGPSGSKPSPSGSKPSPSGSGPGPTGSKPVPIGSKPVPIGNKPVPIRSKPVPIGSKPVPIGSKPVPIGSKPVPSGSKPGPLGSKPGPSGSKPGHVIETSPLNESLLGEGDSPSKGGPLVVGSPIWRGPQGVRKVRHPDEPPLDIRLERLIKLVQALNVPLSEVRILCMDERRAALRLHERYLLTCERKLTNVTCPAYWTLYPRVEFQRIIFPIKTKGSKDSSEMREGEVKVCAFARERDGDSGVGTGCEEGAFKGPSDVEAEGKYFKRLSETPLVYAQVYTALTELPTLSSLAGERAPLWALDALSGDLLRVHATHKHSPAVVRLACPRRPAVAQWLVRLLNENPQRNVKFVCGDKEAGDVSDDCRQTATVAGASL